MTHGRGWLALIAVAGALAWADPAHALVFTVNAFSDGVDANPGDGVCATSPRRLGPVCTLRAAIQEANALGGAHTIVLPSGTYTLSLATGDPFLDGTSDASGPLKIFADVTLTGAGAFTTAIDAHHLYRVLNVVAATVSISGVTIQHGRIVPSGFFSEFSGGGIFNAGTLSLTATRVLHNSAGSGGGIHNADPGVLTMTSVFVGHNAAVFGGGIDNDGTVTITNSTVSSNAAEIEGGGIRNSGTLTIGQSIVSHNDASEESGGGILNLDTMVMDRSTVASNTAGDSGGGIGSFGSDPDVFIPGPFGGGGYGKLATLTITSSTIRNNSGFGGNGGGIRNSAFSTLTLVNSTISGNGVEVSGGGIANSGAMTASNTTIANNVADSADGAGGGLFTFGPSEDDPVPSSALHNTIVADNAGADCGGAAPTSLGHNLDTDSTCALSASGDLSDVSALLAPLALNGGLTLTHALLAGSAAIDTGDSVGCPADDQRGVARPQGSDCDIGAYERVPGESRSSNLSISISADRSRVSPGGALRYTLTVTNTGPEDATGLMVIDRLPPHVAVAAIRSSQGGCTAATRRDNVTVTCGLGQLGVRGTATVTLDVTPDRRGMLVNTAVVTGDVADPDLRNNRATVKTEVR